ncbi:MAG: hypothetical protein F6K40_06160 [Okeania sp. SIO3I5]|nr:hypothetical protein [Okeania sp. SIO3I5]NEQ35892.1 hypothetical protein [Okeania sp. SIO3I5]
MPSNINQMYIYEKNLGSCMAVNANHPEEKRRWSMASGYLHFIRVPRQAAIN